MKIVRMMKDAVLSPFMVLLIPRTLRRMDDLFRSTHELFRRSDELFGKADELFRRTDELFSKADELFRRTDELFSKTDELFRRSDEFSRRVQAAEDWLRVEGMAKISAHVQDAQAASLAAQGMLKSLEANLRDLAQLRAELQRRAGE